MSDFGKIPPADPPYYGIKPWYQSRAVWGGIIAAVCGVLAMLGKAIPAGLPDFLSDQGVLIGGIIGGIVAVFGRIRADTQIGKP